MANEKPRALAITRCPKDGRELARVFWEQQTERRMLWRVGYRTSPGAAEAGGPAALAIARRVLLAVPADQRLEAFRQAIGDQLPDWVIEDDEQLLASLARAWSTREGKLHAIDGESETEELDPDQVRLVTCPKCRNSYELNLVGLTTAGNAGKHVPVIGAAAYDFARPGRLV